MLDRSEAQAEEQPQTPIADTGYWSGANAAMANETTEILIATMKEWKQRKVLREKESPKGRIPKAATIRDRTERKLLTMCLAGHLQAVKPHY